MVFTVSLHSFNIRQFVGVCLVQDSSYSLKEIHQSALWFLAHDDDFGTHKKVEGTEGKEGQMHKNALLRIYPYQQYQPS